jgi:DNA gyrase/topoisomerase IV subunit A
MKRSYLDYAMSVIVARALPDARDGSSRCIGASSIA